MRFMTMLALGTAMALPAMAQTPAHPPVKPHHAVMHHPAGSSPRESVDDKGPYTPEANRAYQGGGVVLEGPPGGPPPPAAAATMPPMR